jgi:hypothetical protein
MDFSLGNDRSAHLALGDAGQDVIPDVAHA